MDKGSFFFLIVILLLVGVFCFLGWTAYHNAQVKKVQAVSVVLPILLFKSFDCGFGKGIGQNKRVQKALYIR